MTGRELIIMAAMSVAVVCSAVYFLCQIAASTGKKEVVLYRKEGAIVSCEIVSTKSCGLTLTCSDGQTVYCATNVEVMR